MMKGALLLTLQKEKIIREYYEQIHVNKLDGIDRLLEIYKLVTLTQAI